ncbi:MAG: hypothetical protein WD512_14340 [Candidatus Paceibacterota bacterium]
MNLLQPFLGKRLGYLHWFILIAISAPVFSISYSREFKLLTLSDTEFKNNLEDKKVDSKQPSKP